MPLQFPNFEKCHCNFQTLKNATATFANFGKRHCNLQTLKNATPDFEKCHRGWHEMAFFKVWKLQWPFLETPDLE